MMNSLLNPEILFPLIVAFAAGLALGAFYFTALWRTVRQLPSTKSPASMMLGSFILKPPEDLIWKLYLSIRSAPIR
jgi:hypothetical protein